MERRPPDRSPSSSIRVARSGTGAHLTTRASIELLADNRGGSVLDAGCGSGVISVAAARLGFAPVHAVDVDPVAVDTALRTASDNGVRVTARRGRPRRRPTHADLLVANIELRIVEALLARATRCDRDHVRLRGCGPPAVRGWKLEDRLELDGWATDVWTPRL